MIVQQKAARLVLNCLSSYSYRIELENWYRCTSATLDVLGQTRNEKGIGVSGVINIGAKWTGRKDLGTSTSCTHRRLWNSLPSKSSFGSTESLWFHESVVLVPHVLTVLLRVSSSWPCLLRTVRSKRQTHSNDCSYDQRRSENAHAQVRISARLVLFPRIFKITNSRKRLQF